MNLQTSFTNNDCYKAVGWMIPKGIMVHSTGANNPNLKRYVGPDDGLLGVNQYGNHWNTATPGGSQVCVHALSSASWKTAPSPPTRLYRGICKAGMAAAVPITRIGFGYARTDFPTPYFLPFTKEAVELCVYLYKQYGLTEKILSATARATKQGIASTTVTSCTGFRARKIDGHFPR